MFAPGDRVRVRRGSRWLACEVMGRVNATEDERWWVRREDTGTRISAPPSAMQSAERPARKLPPPMDAVIGVVVDPTMAPGAWRLENAQPKPQKAARSGSYLSFIRAKDCAWCKAPGPSDPDHFGDRPVGRKCSDFLTVPLCRACHQARTDTNELPDSGGRELTRMFMQRTQLGLLVEWLERKARRG